jgi:uncharacterized protein YbjT (DUF2867 family)
MTMLLKPTVLILGATGQIGRFILEHLKHEPNTIHIRITTRRQEQVPSGDSARPLQNKELRHPYKSG